MATLPQFIPADTLQDLEYPQREAAFFYGLFLRGHSADQLRRDIEVPSAVLAKWHREAQRDPQLKDVFERMVDYRRHVLAIFDALVGPTASRSAFSNLETPKPRPSSLIFANSFTHSPTVGTRYSRSGQN